MRKIPPEEDLLERALSNELSVKHRGPRGRGHKPGTSSKVLEVAQRGNSTFPKNAIFFSLFPPPPPPMLPSCLLAPVLVLLLLLLFLFLSQRSSYSSAAFSALQPDAQFRDSEDGPDASFQDRSGSPSLLGLPGEVDMTYARFHIQVCRCCPIAAIDSFVQYKSVHALSPYFCSSHHQSMAIKAMPPQPKEPQIPATTTNPVNVILG